LDAGVALMHQVIPAASACGNGNCDSGSSWGTLRYFTEENIAICTADASCQPSVYARQLDSKWSVHPACQRLTRVASRGASQAAGYTVIQWHAAVISRETEETDGAPTGPFLLRRASCWRLPARSSVWRRKRPAWSLTHVTYWQMKGLLLKEGMVDHTFACQAGWEPRCADTNPGGALRLGTGTRGLQLVRYHGYLSSL